MKLLKNGGLSMYRHEALDKLTVALERAGITEICYANLDRLNRFMGEGSFTLSRWREVVTEAQFDSRFEITYHTEPGHGPVRYVRRKI